VSIHSLMDDSDRAFEPPARETPEEAFDKAWKTALLRTVRDNLKVHFGATSGADDGRPARELARGRTFGLLE
jgi:hypothetical protein